MDEKKTQPGTQRDTVNQKRAEQILSSIYIFNTELKAVTAVFFRISFCLSSTTLILYSLLSGKHFQPCEKRQSYLLLFPTVCFVSMSPGDYCAALCLLTLHFGWLLPRKCLPAHIPWQHFERRNFSDYSLFLAVQSQPLAPSFIIWPFGTY